jgi:hypothetical protein
MKKPRVYEMKRLLFILFGTGCFLLQAQEELMPVTPMGYIQTGSTIQIWRQELLLTEPIIQISLPVHLTLPVTSRFNVNLDFAYGRADWDFRHLAGSSDAYIQGNYMLMDNRIVLLAGLGTPIGKTRLNYEEYQLSTYLSLNLFRFRMPTYGQGFHGKVGVIGAIPVSDRIVLGGGVTYLYRRGFEPIYDTNWAYQGNTASGRFDPGNEFNIHTGADFGLGENSKIMIDGQVTFYQKDKYAGQTMFRSGTKITINSGYFYRYDDKYLWMLLNVRTKNRNSALQALQFREEMVNTNRPEFDFNLVWKSFGFVGGSVQVLVDGRFYGENEAGLAWGQVLGGGFGADYRISYSTLLEFYIKYLVGQRMSQTKEKWNIEGMDAAITFRYEF